MTLGNSKGIKTSTWAVNEVLHSDDINFIGESAYQNITDQMAITASQQVYDEVFSGLIVEPVSLMTLKVTSGGAVSFSGSYFTDVFWDFVPNPGFVFSVILPEDFQGPITSADPTNPRIDIIEIQPIRETYNSKLRKYKDPVTGLLSDSLTNTRYEYGCSVKVTAGVAGTSPVAPSKTSGWIKLAEVYVGAGVTSIDSSDISTYAYSDSWSSESSTTVPRNLAILSDINNNSDAISTNAGNIATNVTDISTNAGDISTNAGNISTNAGDISDNAGDISTNTGNIGTNTTNISTNAGNISTINTMVNGGATGDVLIKNSATNKDATWGPITLSNVNASTLDGLDSSQFLRSDVADSIDQGTNTTLTLRSNDNGRSEIDMIGDAQGTGVAYVGQSTTHGGGIFYNGDGTPAYATGERSDAISLFRRTASENIVVLDCSHSSSVMDFKSTPTVASNTVWHAGNDGAGSGLDADTVDGANKTTNFTSVSDTKVPTTKAVSDHLELLSESFSSQSTNVISTSTHFRAPTPSAIHKPMTWNLYVYTNSASTAYTVYFDLPTTGTFAYSYIASFRYKNVVYGSVILGSDDSRSGGSNITSFGLLKVDDYQYAVYYSLRYIRI